MSDDTSIQEGLPEIGDQVDEAVAEGQEAAPEETVQAVAGDVKATLKDPKASKTEKIVAAKTLRKLKIKFDQKEYEEDLPFDIPNTPQAIEYMQKQLQMSRLAQTRAQEKSTLEKEVMQFLDDLKKNPRKALSDPAIGIDIKQLATSIIEEEIENSRKSPDQLAKEKLETELRALKEERENEKKARDENDRQRLTEQEYERLDMQMTQALEKHNFPKNPAVIKRMADYLMIALEAKKDVSVEDIVPLIKDDLKDDYKSLLNSLPDDDALEDFIGKEFVDRIRRKNVARAKKANSNPAVKAPTKAPATGQKTEAKPGEKKTTFKNFFGV